MLGESMLSFYYINKDYANYLRNFDTKVPALDYDSHDKFFCGIVLSIQDNDYYVPISHDTIKYQTSMRILDKGRPISSLKFSFMIPIPNTEIKRIDFNEIAKEDPKYADLLRAEYKFCAANEANIINKANAVYLIGNNPNHKLHDICCNFKILEEKCKEYIVNTQTKSVKNTDNNKSTT